MKFEGQEPRPRPETRPHVFIMGKVATQCARCYLREHNEIHIQTDPAVKAVDPAAPGTDETRHFPWPVYKV